MNHKQGQIAQGKKERHGFFWRLVGLAMAISGMWLLNVRAEPLQGSACFRDHVLEGRTINRERRPLYRLLTSGDSLAVSDRLIASESLSVLLTSIIPAYDFDAEAIPYQQAGVNIVCDDFVSMTLVPRFRPRFKNGAPELADFSSPDPWALQRQLRAALNTSGFDGLHTELETQIAELDREPRFNCLLHHVLDSMARIAALAPQYDTQAAALGLPSPTYISTNMIEAHLLVLGDTVHIDQLAAPIQARDVPILCQDVPPIDTNPVLRKTLAANVRKERARRNLEPGRAGEPQWP